MPRRKPKRDKSRAKPAKSRANPRPAKAPKKKPARRSSVEPAPRPPGLTVYKRDFKPRSLPVPQRFPAYPAGPGQCPLHSGAPPLVSCPTCSPASLVLYLIAFVLLLINAFYYHSFWVTIAGLTTAALAFLWPWMAHKLGKH